MAEDWPSSFPSERQEEKREGERERRYGERRRRSSPAPHFSSPLFLLSPPPSVWLPPSHLLPFFLSSLAFLGRKWKAKGEQEVRFIWRVRCKVWKGSEGLAAEGGSALVEAYVGRREDVCVRALTWRRMCVLHVHCTVCAHLYLWCMRAYMWLLSDGCV